MSRGSNGPDPIDEVLARAEVLAGEYDDYDEEAALDRIAHRVVWRKATRLEQCARNFRHAEQIARSTRPSRGRQPFTDDPILPEGRDDRARHARAAAHLGALCSRVVRDPAAIAAMAMLVDDPAIEPAGALAFACLLYLADRHEAAQFWWQFAAGSGSCTAAHCLYLDHLQRSERAVADWWFNQAALLHEQGAAPRLDEPPVPPKQVPWPIVVTFQLDVAFEVTDEAKTAYEARWWVFSTSLAAAVRRLDAEDDFDYGTIPKIDPDLAAELEDCAASA